MSFLGAFLQSFGGTTLELQKREQEQRQFEQTLAVHQAAMNQTQQRFDQEMALRESERQDKLQQNEQLNTIAAFKANTAAAGQQSREQAEIARRKYEEQQKLINTVTAEGGAQGMNDLRYQIQKKQAAGQDTTQDEANLAQMQEHFSALKGITLGDQAPPSSAVPTPNPGSSGGTGGAQPLSAPPGGGGSPDMLTGTPAPAPQQFPVQGPTQQQAGMVPTPPARAATVPSSEAGGPTVKIAATQAEADARNEENKTHKYFGETWVGQDTLDKKHGEDVMAQEHTLKSEGNMRASDAGRAEINDVLKRNNIDATFDATPTTTERKSQVTSVRLGRMLSGPVKVGESRSTGSTQTDLPTGTFTLNTRPSWMNSLPGIGGWFSRQDATIDPDFANKLATALAQNAAATGKKLDPVVTDAAQDWVRVNGDVIEQLIGSRTKPIVLEPFDSGNRPEVALAAQLAKGGDAAETQLRQAAGKYTDVGMPPVIDRQLPMNQTLGLFRQAVGGLAKVGTGPAAESPQGTQNAANPQSEEDLLKELAMRLRPDVKDGSYSPGTKAEAEKAWNEVDKSAVVSPQFKQGVYNLLKPVISQPTTPEGQKMATKETSQAEEPAQPKGTPSGVPGMTGALTMAALGGLGQVSQQKAGQTPPKTPPTPQSQPQASKDAQAIQTEFSSIKGAQDREQRAKDAASKIESTWGRLSDDEKKRVQTQWTTTRGSWKSLGVSDEVLKKIDDIIGKKQEK